MRQVAFLIAALLSAAATSAIAGSDADMLKQQRARIDHAITERNALLDRIHFTGGNNDSAHLASINASELTVAYALQALESVVAVVRPIAQSTNDGGARGLRSVGEPMQTLCQIQVDQMVSDSAELADSRIRDEVQKQIDNVRAACGAIVAVTN